MLEGFVVLRVPYQHSHLADKGPRLREVSDLPRPHSSQGAEVGFKPGLSDDGDVFSAGFLNTGHCLILERLLNKINSGVAPGDMSNFSLPLLT